MLKTHAAWERRGFGLRCKNGCAISLAERKVSLFETHIFLTRIFCTQFLYTLFIGYFALVARRHKKRNYMSQLLVVQCISLGNQGHNVYSKSESPYWILKLKGECVLERDRQFD